MDVYNPLLNAAINFILPPTITPSNPHSFHCKFATFEQQTQKAT